MRKGFLHIVEIVIVALMAFLVLVQFSYLPKQNPDWGSMKLSIQANDILFSLEKKGVDWFNSTQVDQVIFSFVSNNTIYSLKIRNVMKPYIDVGCICSAAERTALANMLQPFWINGQPVSFTVTAINPSSVEFSHGFDVIVNFDYNLTNNYTQIRQFLGAGKGIVEFRHLDQSEIDAVQTDLFGLEWNSSLGSPDNNPVEFRSNESSDTYYNIYKYFHNIPIYQENFASGAAPGWSPETGSWRVNSQNYLGDSASSPKAESYYNRQFNDTYSMRAWFKFDGASDVILFLYRWFDWNSNIFRSVYIDFDDVANMITVFDNSSGTTISKGSASYALDSSSWYDVRIIPQPDSTIKVYINNSLVLTSQPVTITPNTQIGFGVQGGLARFDNIWVTFAEKHNFSPSLLLSEKVQPADFQKVILLQNSTQLPACIANSNIVDGKGRTAWLAYADPVANQDVSNMLKTLVVWAAGEENDVITNDVRNVPVVNSIYRTYNQDMYQPVEIVLTMGNMYGTS